MTTKLYPLTGENENEKKVWYPLNLSMRMRTIFLYEDEYEITRNSSVVIPVYVFNSKTNY